MLNTQSSSLYWCVGIKPDYGSSATRLFKVLCMLCIGVSIKLIKEPHCMLCIDISKLSIKLNSHIVSEGYIHVNVVSSKNRLLVSHAVRLIMVT